MAVKSLSISDKLLEKITREAKQKNLSFSELVSQKISQSYEPTSLQKNDHSTEKIFTKIDALDTNFKLLLSFATVFGISNLSSGSTGFMIE